MGVFVVNSLSLSSTALQNTNTLTQVPLQMRVFVVNSEDAKAVGEYINGHLNQVCAPVAASPVAASRLHTHTHTHSLSLSLSQYCCLAAALPRGTTQRATKHSETCRGHKKKIRWADAPFVVYVSEGERGWVIRHVCDHVICVYVSEGERMCVDVTRV
jgi:hypothetical protein